MRKKTSKFRGVCWHKALQKWQSYICLDKRVIYIGVHKNQKEAAKAYNKAAKYVHEGKARLNRV